MGLSPEDLAVREIDVISIRDDPIAPEKYKPEEDPSTYHSEKTGRGPLAADWVSTSAPLMCCYKICRVNVAVRRPLLELASPIDRSNCQDLSSRVRAMITNALWHLLGAVTCKWWGIQTRVEDLVRSGLRDLMVQGHRQGTCVRSCTCSRSCELPPDHQAHVRSVLLARPVVRHVDGGHSRL